MDISNHIINLLQSNEQVVVPGLGTFVVEYNSAKINTIDNTFSPPSKKVIFDSFTPEDNILAEYISKNEGVPLEDANFQIKEFVENILNSIQGNKECDIKGLGKFIITKENQIAFFAFEKNFSDEHFGLPEFAASEVSKNNNKEKNQLSTEKAERDNKNVFNTKKRRKLIIFPIVVIIFSLFLFLVFFTDIFRSKITDNKSTTDIALQNEKVSPQNHSTQIFSKDTVIQQDNVAKEEVSPKKELKPEKSLIEQKNLSKQSNFYLVAGSFKQEENAIKRVNELIAKGYKYAGVTRNNNKGLYIVYYSAYTTRLEAEKQQEIIKKEENPETWILKN